MRLNPKAPKNHPNTWASLKTFQLICDMFCLCPTPSNFLHYYTSHSIDPVSWLSLINCWVTYFLPRSHPYTKISRVNFLKYLLSPRVKSFSLTSVVGPNSPCIGLRPHSIQVMTSLSLQCRGDEILRFI